MSFITTVLLAGEHQHELAELPIPGVVIAGIAAAFFLFAGLVTYSYRDVANRHSDRVSDDAGAGHHGQH